MKFAEYQDLLPSEIFQLRLDAADEYEYSREALYKLYS